ncbi:hypothetical protein [Oceaniglobus trochenteri]|uniref:hypothetical protein n=1 Tax=Oceaniglobus trochenteri TaxID=2763260 RepID=UPI001CFF69D2|nr:hypothetical protein [Oceaniglobus trochenteri]
MTRQIRIIGVTIDDWHFETAPARHNARVQFEYGTTGGGQAGTTDCLCHSSLPADAPLPAVRDALIQNALGQLRRMPEVWLGEADLTLCAATENVRLNV